MISSCNHTREELITLKRKKKDFMQWKGATFEMLTEQKAFRYRYTNDFYELFGYGPTLTSESLKAMYCSEIDSIRDYEFSKATIELQIQYPKIGILTEYNIWKKLPNGKIIISRVIRRSIVINVIENGQEIQTIYYSFVELPATRYYQPLTSHIICLETNQVSTSLSKKVLSESKWKILEHLNLTVSQRDELLDLCSMTQKEMAEKYKITPDGVKSMKKRYRELLAPKFYENYNFGNIKEYLRICELI